MLELLAIVLGGIVTFVTRAIFLVSKKLRPPKRVERYLPLVGPAVLGAIAIPGILAPRGEISLVDTVPAVIAAVATWLGWKFTKQIAVGLIVGLGLWWAILAVMVAMGVER
ncbi:AzlD domain-containing protein [Pseudolysinimonas sp.]|uniref:AzlD domain-containing protein n=1 Tax=Pseudolysinimonas sp. TaxID=2680009 RepID=UPI00286D6641|nr:AzlD domain-containing protein [Pseudolysinimonas sp.]